VKRSEEGKRGEEKPAPCRQYTNALHAAGK